MIDRPAFTVGIEEEYLVVDRATRDLIKDPPPEMWSSLREVLGPQVAPEFLKAQIEVGTKVCTRLDEAREDLATLRRDLSAVVGRHGAAIIASSTHPFADWSEQVTTEHPRYQRVAADYQQVARQMVICGMHVHVGIDDDHLRIDLMNQVRYMLPHLLALSTSSPFWAGTDTGLLAYRLVIFKNMPRTGLPEEFVSWGEYERMVAVLVEAGIIEDATKLWWDLRPSARFPTLEMRITDVCPLIDDSIAIASLYLCILRMLYRLRRQNQRWRHYPPFLVRENRWRAQRYGIEQGMVDFGKGEVVPFAVLLEELFDLVAEDAAFFGCAAEVVHARTIVERGTSADRQLARYDAVKKLGGSEQAALMSVVDGIIEETMMPPASPRRAASAKAG